MPLFLKNKTLEVIIDKPGEVYNACRFDWTGQVSQVTLNGYKTFCTTEKENGELLNAKGIGLCNEFGIETAVGYDDCKVGDWFHKIGVGLLRKDCDTPYDFFKTYEIETAMFDCKQVSDSVVMTIATQKRCNGYSYILLKKFKVYENSLFICYTLRNDGEKLIKTEEYCHNFININNNKVDQAYKLILDSEIDRYSLSAFVNPDDCTEMHENVISWNKTPDADFFLSNLNSGQFKYNKWTLEHCTMGLNISESTDFVPAKFNIWGKGHVISPELFINIELLPGKTLKWQRKYDFFEFEN